MGPRYLYVLDVDIDPATLLHQWKRRPSMEEKNQPGRLELLETPPLLSDDDDDDDDNKSVDKDKNNKNNAKPRVVIVGAGPAGLFCALQLARSGRITPVILERGQPVEARGRDIGALVHR